MSAVSFTRVNSLDILAFTSEKDFYAFLLDALFIGWAVIHLLRLISVTFTYRYS